VIAAICVADWIAGDPEWFPHPVRLMGRCIQIGESRLRRSGQSAGESLIAGGVLALGVVGLSWLGARWARRGGSAIEVLLGWTCVASRNLIDESAGVIHALEEKNLPLARLRVARIVGRDTAVLTESGVARAVIETLAESACDGVVAPLFYMALGGVELAMAYKAVNTLDSMIGHADERYFYFGKVAARLDDAANYLPSRLTALLIAIVAGVDGPSTVRIWRRDGGKHKSPNAGQPESAMAGSLRVRLGGENVYAGERIAGPLLGAEFDEPQLPQAKRALKIVIAVSLLGSAAAVWFAGLRKN
jgi:adenosylcobinamide-phosphate synthase